MYTIPVNRLVSMLGHQIQYHNNNPFEVRITRHNFDNLGYACIKHKCQYDIVSKLPSDVWVVKVTPTILKI